MVEVWTRRRVPARGRGEYTAVLGDDMLISEDLVD